MVKNHSLQTDFSDILKGVAYNHIGLEVEQEKTRLQVGENDKERG